LAYRKTRNFKLKNFALTPRQSFPVLWRGNHREDVWKDDDHADDTEPLAYFNLAEASGSPVMAGTGIEKKPAETSVLYTTMSIRSASGMKPVGFVNHTSWIIADPKALPLLALDRSQWSRVTKQPSPIWTLDVPWYHESGEDRWMELVLNNMDEKGHVFHLVSAGSPSQRPCSSLSTPFEISVSN
jgi:hypothetical protein